MSEIRHFIQSPVKTSASGYGFLPNILDYILDFSHINFVSCIVYDDITDDYYQPLIGYPKLLPNGYLEYIALALRDLGATEAEVTEFAPNVAAYAAAVCGKARLSGRTLQVARRLVRRGERDEANPEHAFPTVGSAKTINRLVETYKARRNEVSLAGTARSSSDEGLRAARRFVATFERLRTKAPERAAEFATDKELRLARHLLNASRPRSRRARGGSDAPHP